MGHRQKNSADIVYVKERIENGPAENSFILVECNPPRRARYISWIGYFDIEYAGHREGENWLLIEPGKNYQTEAEWRPYGWEGADPVPTIGDSILEQIIPRPGV